MERGLFRILVKSQNERDYLEDLDVGGMVVIK
jgi:hypothetical protein